MTIKPQSIWIVLARRKSPGYEAQRFVLGRHLVLICQDEGDVIAAPSLDELRAKLPAGLHVDKRFPFTDPTIVEAWAA